MDNYDLLTLQGKKKGNMDLYKETLVELFEKELSWKEVQSLDRKEIRKIIYALDTKIKLDRSPIEIKKLARAIQHSRSGIGGSAMTPYTCHFCEKQEVWINTAVPNICLECATKMATKIAMYHSDIFKEGAKKDGN